MEYANLMKITEALHINREIEAQLHLVSSLAYATSLHYHDYYEFFLITGGSCSHYVNGGVQHLTEGALVFIRPEDYHEYGQEEGDCSFLNMAFTKEAVHDAFRYLGDAFCSRRVLEAPMPPYTLLSPLEADHLISRCEKLETLAMIDRQQSRLQTRGLIIELFSQYFTDTRDSSKKTPALWVEMLLAQMQKKENFTVGLGRMYEISGRSVGHLNRVFRQLFQVTPTEYINRIRLSYAKNLLINTGLSITSISLEAGFENLSHFNHQFRKYFGTTPTALRSTAKQSGQAGSPAGMETE